MPLLVDERYAAKVERPKLTTNDKGSDGIFVHFNCGTHGNISHTIWLTPARIEYAQKDLNNLGVSTEKLASDEFWDNITQWLDGAECEIVIGEEEYNGKTRLKVKFINATVKAASPGASKRLAGLFSSRVAATAGSSADEWDGYTPKASRY